MLGKILFAFMFAQGPANRADGAVRGQIIVPETHASAQILVTLFKADGPIVGRTYSDTLGNYDFHGLLPGTYVINVKLEGYEEVRTEVGVGSGSFGVAVANIVLHENELTIKVGGNPADDAISINELSRKYPRKAVQDYERALEEIRKGNDAKATDLITNVVKLAPEYYAAHLTLGTLYQKARRFRDGETEYRRASELNPSVADPLLNLGSLFIEEADARANEGKNVVGKILDDALDTLEDGLKHQRSAFGYYLLGTAYYKSTFYEEAEDNLKHAVEMDAHMGPSHLMLANLYMKQRKWQSALEHLDSYLVDNPKASDRTEIEQTRAKVAARIR
jgi:Tfp pilus assembly protein PilF